MDVREKLVELLNEVQETGVNEIPAGFGCTREYVKNEKVASHLIAHGVTVQDNTEIIDELLERLRKAPVTVMTEEPTVEVVQEWIAVKDGLPEKDVRVLVWMQDNEEGYTQMDTDRWSCTMEQGYHWIRWGKSVTHWMPLPQPPKGE